MRRQIVRPEIRFGFHDAADPLDGGGTGGQAPIGAPVGVRPTQIHQSPAQPTRFPQEGMPPVTASPLRPNGVPMTGGFTNPPLPSSPLSQGFISNSNQRLQHRSFGT